VKERLEKGGEEGRSSQGRKRAKRRNDTGSS
jgi:hypothetical protein